MRITSEPVLRVKGDWLEAGVVQEVDYLIADESGLCVHRIAEGHFNLNGHTRCQRLDGSPEIRILVSL